VRQFWLPLLALLGLAAPVLAQAGGASPPPAAPPSERNTNIDFEQKLGAQVPLDLPFRDEGNRRVTLRECMLPGKPAILVLAYYRCPMLCTEVLNGLVDVMRNVPYTAGTDYTVLTVSFDPREHGDIATAKKQAYLQAYGRAGAENGWRFLTGERRPIDDLTAAVGFKYEFDKAFKEYNHASGIMILTPEGKISRYFYGISFLDEKKDLGDPNEVRTAKNFRLSLVEASDGKIGSFTDKVLLTCYRFDHLKKGYALNVMFVVRASAVATVLLLALTVTGFLVRERRKAARTAAAAPAAAPTDTPPGVAT
jgi:protein SCO1/2